MNRLSVGGNDAAVRTDEAEGQGGMTLCACMHGMTCKVALHIAVQHSCHLCCFMTPNAAPPKPLCIGHATPSCVMPFHAAPSHVALRRPCQLKPPPAHPANHERRIRLTPSSRR